MIWYDELSWWTNFWGNAAAYFIVICLGILLTTVLWAPLLHELGWI